MAILRGIDGTFYEVPDNALENFKVPADKVKEILKDMSEEMMDPPPSAQGPMTGAPAPAGSAPPQVVVQIITNGGAEPQVNGAPSAPAPSAEGDVTPQAYCGGWRNSWRNNPWRNNTWRNCG